MSRRKLLCYPVNFTGGNQKTTTKSRAVAIIPARFASSRLPGKVLAEVAGKPMVCWVAERAMGAHNVSQVIVATDDRRVLNAVESAGYEAVMTGRAHQSGTDRIAEVAAQLSNADIIVNVQSDEPLIQSETVDQAVNVLLAASVGQDGAAENADAGPGIVTTCELFENAADVLDPDVVKVVADEGGRALYFSRTPLPFPREAVRKHGSLEAALKIDVSLLANFRKHTGLYVYRRDVLLQFARWPQSRNEKVEGLEQLRALEHGVQIRVIESRTRSIGVDTMADLDRVRAILET